LITIVFILAWIINSIIVWSVGWAMQKKFKSWINLKNWVLKKPEWRMKKGFEEPDAPVYADSFDEAVAIGRIHGSLIVRE